MYPVKSLRGIEVKDSQTDDYGFNYDRICMLAIPSEDGKTLRAFDQHQEPRLVLVKTAIEDDHIVVSYDNFEFRLPTDPSQSFADAPSVSLSIWGNECECFDITHEIDISPVFNQVIQSNMLPRIRLLAPKLRRAVGEAPDFLPENSAARKRFSKSVPRVIKTTFQELYPCHFVTTASFEALQRHIDSGPDETYQVKPENFRPNLVIETDDPWDEDDWEYLRIGDHEWYTALSTPRCVITSVDTTEGKFRKSKEPRTSLGKFRVLSNRGNPSIGRYMAHRDPNTSVRVGDPVEVLTLNS